MATLEELNMAKLAMENIAGLRANIRDNLKSYQALVVRGSMTLDKAFSLTKKDVVQYRKRIKWMTDIQANPARRARVRSGFGALGLTDLTEIVGEITAITAAVDILDAIVDPAGLQQGAASALAVLPGHDRVWE